MNLQQSVQPIHSVNGYRRKSKELGLRPENRVQAGKSNQNRLNNTGAVPVGKVGIYESSSQDRLIYLATCLIGHLVEVQLKNGSIYTGTCHTTNIENEFAIVLKMARLTKDVSSTGQKGQFVSKPPIKKFIIPGKEVVQVIAKDLPVTMDQTSNELEYERSQDLLTDSCISQSHHVEVGRELEPWVPDGDDPKLSELENIFDAPWNRGWDQFEANKLLFGVKSTFDEELYTTKLERGPQMRDLEREAIRIAREIEGEETHDLHLAEERGIHIHGSFDIDEETRFSSVYRGRVVDDSGYDDAEDILLDSQNNETFGGPSTASIGDSADWTHGKSNDGTQVSASCSVDEPPYSQQSTSSDLYQSGSYDDVRQLASELHSKSSISESDISNQENMHGDFGGNSSLKEFTEEQPLAEDAQFPKCEDPQSTQMSKNEGSDQGGLSPNVASTIPSHVSSKCHEDTSSLSKLADSTVVKEAVGVQSASSHRQTGVPTSSNYHNMVTSSASSGCGLSPSSSVGSLSSEKSSLNPHAKEFKLNPNAKSFTPSQPHVRPASPVTDGSFYFPANMSAIPPVHGMHMGIGIGPSFPGHQPVIFNPQVAPLQSPQAYFHPGGPQYGQQMLLGHPRQVFYVPGQQPEMPFKGRDY